MTYKCDICKKTKFKDIIIQSVRTGPDSGKLYHICKECFSAGKLPKNYVDTTDEQV